MYRPLFLNPGAVVLAATVRGLTPETPPIVTGSPLAKT